jgi:hypothetical protein
VKRNEKTKEIKKHFSFCFFFVCFFFFFSSISPLSIQTMQLKSSQNNVFDFRTHYQVCTRTKTEYFAVCSCTQTFFSKNTCFKNMTRKKRKFVFKHLTWKKEPIRHLVFSLYFFFFYRFVCCFHICIFLVCFSFLFKKKEKKKHKKRKQNKNSFCKTKEKKKEK